MATEYDKIWKGKGYELEGDGLLTGEARITKAVTLDTTLAVTGATTLTGAVGITAALTFNAGLACTPAAIAADGTLAGKGLYVFNGANAAANMPLVATYDGYEVAVTNINGTGSLTLTANATDSAELSVGGASASTYVVTPNTTVRLTAYAAGTVWVGN